MKKIIQIACCAVGSGMVGFFANKLNTIIGCVFFTLGVVLLVASIALISKSDDWDNKSEKPMKKITFSSQLMFGICVMAVCLVIAFFTKIEVFQNIAWISYGLLFLINPVVPRNVPDEKVKKVKIAIMICSVIIICLGVTLNGTLLG